jgi:hypothetical protein
MLPREADFCVTSSTLAFSLVPRLKRDGVFVLGKRQSDSNEAMIGASVTGAKFPGVLDTEERPDVLARGEGNLAMSAVEGSGVACEVDIEVGGLADEAWLAWGGLAAEAVELEAAFVRSACKAARLAARCFVFWRFWSFHQVGFAGCFFSGLDMEGVDGVGAFGLRWDGPWADMGVWVSPFLRIICWTSLLASEFVR